MYNHFNTRTLKESIPRLVKHHVAISTEQKLHLSSHNITFADFMRITQHTHLHIPQIGIYSNQLTSYHPLNVLHQPHTYTYIPLTNNLHFFLWFLNFSHCLLSISTIYAKDSISFFDCLPSIFINKRDQRLHYHHINENIHINKLSKYCLQHCVISRHIDRFHSIFKFLFFYVYIHGLPE